MSSNEPSPYGTDPYAAPGTQPTAQPGQQPYAQPAQPAYATPGVQQPYGAEQGYAAPGAQPYGAPGAEGVPPGYAPGAYPPPYPGYPEKPAQDPGRTLGIVGFVLVFVFTLAGLIVSLIARSQSKKAGFKNRLANWGVGLSITFMALGVVLAGLAIAGVLSSGDSSNPVTAAKNVVSNVKFCAADVQLSQEMSAVGTPDANDPSAYVDGITKAAADLKAVKPPAAIATDWATMTHFFDELATPLSKVDKSDPDAVSGALADISPQLQKDLPGLETAGGNIDAYAQKICS